MQEPNFVATKFCWFVRLNFNQTLLLLVHILDETYLLLFLVNYVVLEVALLDFLAAQFAFN